MNWKLGILFGILGISFCVFLGLSIRDSGKCQNHIVLTDGSQMDCIAFHSSREGITHIRTCDGKKIIIPTSRIKEITEK